MAEPLVLLVDDDPDFLIINRVYLEAAGYRVREAPSAAAGLEQALVERPDLAIVDLMMEEMDAGVWLAQQMSLRPELAGTPVVILTGVREETGFDFTLRTDEERAWLKVCEWVEKPLPRERLLALVERILRDRGGDR